MVFSTSIVEMFSPPLMMMSFAIPQLDVAVWVHHPEVAGWNQPPRNASQ